MWKGYVTLDGSFYLTYLPLELVGKGSTLVESHYVFCARWTDVQIEYRKGNEKLVLGCSTMNITDVTLP